MEDLTLYYVTQYYEVAAVSKERVVLQLQPKFSGKEKKGAMSHKCMYTASVISD